MALKTISSVGLCVLFVCLTTAFPISSAEKDIFDLKSPCIVNVTNPNCTKCTPGTYVPYPHDPTMFYQCDNGELFPMHCKPNTVWNQTLHTCVKTVDEDASCFVNTTDTNCTKCKPGTYQPIPDDPAMFYQCSNGVLHPKYCKPDTVWDQDSKTCVNEDIFDLESTCIVNVTNPNCTKCTRGTYAPYPHDPTMFYQCNNGELFPMHCKPNTVWNQTMHSCVNTEMTSTDPYDSKTVTSTLPVSTSITTPLQTTPETSSQSFDAASFGGGIGVGIVLALIVLLMVRLCCHASEKDGYDQQI